MARSSIIASNVAGSGPGEKGVCTRRGLDYNGAPHKRHDGVPAALSLECSRSPWQGCARSTAATRSPQNHRDRVRQRVRLGVMRDPGSVHRLRALRRSCMIVLAAGALLMTGCEEPSNVPDGRPALAVAVLPGPMTWSVGPDGQIRGLDHDLLSRFARERGLALRVSFADSAAALLDSVRRGAAQLGAGGLLGPDASTGTPCDRLDPRIRGGEAGGDLQPRWHQAPPLGRPRRRDAGLSRAHRIGRRACRRPGRAPARSLPADRSRVVRRADRPSFGGRARIRDRAVDRRECRAQHPPRFRRSVPHRVRRRLRLGCGARPARVARCPRRVHRPTAR